MERDKSASNNCLTAEREVEIPAFVIWLNSLTNGLKSDVQARKRQKFKLNFIKLKLYLWLWLWDSFPSRNPFRRQKSVFLPLLEPICLRSRECLLAKSFIFLCAVFFASADRAAVRLTCEFYEKKARFIQMRHWGILFHWIFLSVLAITCSAFCH